MAKVKFNVDEYINNNPEKVLEINVVLKYGQKQHFFPPYESRMTTKGFVEADGFNFYINGERISSDDFADLFVTVFIKLKDPNPFKAFFGKTITAQSAITGRDCNILLNEKQDLTDLIEFLTDDYYFELEKPEERKVFLTKTLYTK
jgi:hypothetical protein